VSLGKGFALLLQPAVTVFALVSLGAPNSQGDFLGLSPQPANRPTIIIAARSSAMIFFMCVFLLK
jgi:hypothetical protein